MTVLETQIGCITYANSALPWLPGARGWKRTSSGKRRLINGVCHSGQEVAVGVPHLCCLRSIRWNVRFQFIQPFSAFLGVSALSSNLLTIHLSGTCTAFASLVFPKTLYLLPRSGCVCGFFLRYELVYNTNLTCLHFLRMSLCCDVWFNTSEKVRRIPRLPPDPELRGGQGNSSLVPVYSGV